MTETMDLDPAYLAEQLRLIRKQMGLTQQNVADACNLTVRTIEKLERGNHTPNEQTLKSLARGLGINTRSLFKPSAADQEATRVEILKSLRTTAVVHTSIVATAHDLVAALDNVQAWLRDMREVRNESLDTAARLLDLIFDWGAIWDEISLVERLEAARGMAELLEELRRTGHLVHMGRYREQRRLGPGKPFVMRVGVVMIRDKAESETMKVALVPLQDGAELPREDWPDALRELDGTPS